MDCKRVTVIRIGPVISTRMKALHGMCGAFLFYSSVVSPYVPFHEKKRLSQPAGRDKTLFILLCAQAHFEVLIAKVHQLPAIACCAQQPDMRQGHPIEGVVLAGGIWPYRRR